jgi:DNA-directed RNA polymerase specialized sigma24 family protein
MASTRDNKAGSIEYGKFAKRMIRAYGLRARKDGLDPDSLTQLMEIQALLDEQMREVVAALREDGFSWSQIADALGMDRGNCSKKYGSK